MCWIFINHEFYLIMFLPKKPQNLPPQWLACIALKYPSGKILCSAFLEKRSNPNEKASHFSTRSTNAFKRQSGSSDIESDHRELSASTSQFPASPGRISAPVSKNDGEKEYAKSAFISSHPAANRGRAKIFQPRPTIV